MRGFGVVQACFAHESQMDRLAEACGLDPVEVRLRNAMQTGDRLITGQVVESVAPVARCIRETAALPLPVEPVGGLDGDPLRLPGGSGLTADRDHVRAGRRAGACRSRTSCTPRASTTSRPPAAGWPTAWPRSSSPPPRWVRASSRSPSRSPARILGVDEVVLEPMDTSIGSAGSTSASRQTWMSGGAVDSACRAVRERLFEHVARQHGLDPLQLVIDDDAVVDTVGTLRVPVAEATAGQVFEEELEYHHRPTTDLDELGQGNCHTAFAFVAHRAVVDVDPGSGLVRVVQIATAQDVGRALNPLSVQGQIEGGIAQGLGLAVMEEIVLEEGRIRNASFTDYLLPTFLDAPEVVASLVEEPDPQAPLGAKGVGEPPCISVTPAIVAAIRAATGRQLDQDPGAAPGHRVLRVATGLAPTRASRPASSTNVSDPVTNWLLRTST